MKQMKSQTLRRIVLVAMLALFIAGTSLVLAPPDPDLVLEKITVASLPPSNGRRYFNTEPDTQVSIFIKDNTWSPVRRLVKELKWDLAATNRSLLLLDDKGNQYRSTIYTTEAQDQGRQRYRINSRFSLALVPNSVFEVTVKATVAADKGKSLPVTIIIPSRSRGSAAGPAAQQALAQTAKAAHSGHR